MLTQLSTRRSTGPQALVELLLECHQRIRYFIALAHACAARRDVPSAQIVQTCADVERYFREALPLHVADEEQSIEPRLRGLSPEVDNALDLMARQHRQHDTHLAALLHASANVRSRPRDEAARNELAAVASTLERELDDHLRTEEEVLFPAIRALLPRHTQTAVIDELRERRSRPNRHPHSRPE